VEFSSIQTPWLCGFAKMTSAGTGIAVYFFVPLIGGIFTGRIGSAYTAEKIAVVAPIPNPRVITAVQVNAGSCRIWRSP
jgi:hypothetical protein